MKARAAQAQGARGDTGTGPRRASETLVFFPFPPARHSADGGLRQRPSGPVRPSAPPETVLVLPASPLISLRGPDGRRTIGAGSRLAHTGTRQSPIKLPAGVDWAHLTLIVLLAAAAAFQAGCFAFGVW